MSTTTNPSHPSAQARDAKIIAGILKRLQNVPSIVLGGVTYTPAALAALFQSHIDAANAVDSLRGQWKNAIQAYRALSRTVSNAVMGLREIVRQMFNNAPDALADFGFTPRKAGMKQPATQVAAAAKARATRAARGTRGKKQKLAIKGDVTGVVVTPTTNEVGNAASPPAPTSAPHA